MSLSCQLECFFSGPLDGSISISFKASSSLEITKEVHNKLQFAVSRLMLRLVSRRGMFGRGVCLYY